MKHVVEWLLHAVKDTLPMLPWILLMYVIIQLLENKTALKNAGRFGGKLGPVIGSATGLIPQCGFSVMSAKFYEQKYISLGTLLAIFFSTSDEAFLMMVASGTGAVWVLPTIAIKMLVGIGVGYGADMLLKAMGRGQTRAVMPETEKVERTPKTTRDIFMSRYLEDKDVEVVCACGRAHETDSAWKKYLWYPLLHALQIALFIFLVNFTLTAIVHSVGEEKFSTFMQNSALFQPLITCAIGLIPNCASSAVISQTFLSGGITFGSMVAGLCVNAGMGYVVLFKNTRRWKRNLALVGISYAVSVIVGLALNIYPLWIS